MDPFLGSLAIFSFPFAPKNWAFCNGQILSINQNQALFALLGTTYGGDGRTTFALPNLQGRAAMHMGSQSGSTYTWGQVVGQNSPTLGVNSLPSHTHTFSYQPPCNTSVGTTADPTDNYPAATASNIYGSPADTNLGYASQGPATVLTQNAGNSQPFNAMQPSLALNFCIALAGIFPSRN